MSATHRRFRFALATSFATLAFTLAGSALAQGPATPEAPPVAKVEPKQVGIAANPLSALVGRYGVDVTYMPALHHGLVLNPFYQRATAESSTTINGTTSTSSTTFSGFGGELGYRYYTGEKGPNGFFVGPSFIFGSYAQSNSSGNSVSFTSVGAALDIGGQYVADSGFMIGGGFGLQYTKTSTKFEDLPFAAAVLAGGGVRPRFLFTIGYAF